MTEISDNGMRVYRLIKGGIDTTGTIKRHCLRFGSVSPNDTADALTELSNAGLIRYQEAGELWIME